VRVHLAGKHALELETLHLGGQSPRIGFDLPGSACIGFLGRQFRKLTRIAQPARQLIQTRDDLLELRALPAKILRAIRVVPNAGLFELAGYFLQPLVLVLVIKDTSSKNRSAARDLL